jgi:hypothetical protein
VRAARGVLLAGVTASLAVAAHAVGGGELPDAGLTLLVTVLVGWAGTALADRRRGPVAVVGVLGVSHLVLHVILSVPPGLAHRHALTGLAGIDPGAMFGTHALAVVLTGLVLARLAVLAVSRMLSTVTRRPVEPLPARAPLWVPVAPLDAADTAREVLLSRSCARRGPPALP